MTDDERNEWAARTVVILYGNESIRKQFMDAYNTKSPDVIKAFLTDRIGMPDELATPISQGRDQALSNYIGKLVCDYLW